MGKKSANIRLSRFSKKELKDWATKKMKIFIEIIQPELDKMK